MAFFISPKWKAVKRNLAFRKVVTRGSGHDAARALRARRGDTRSLSRSVARAETEARGTLPQRVSPIASFTGQGETRLPITTCRFGGQRSETKADASRLTGNAPRLMTQNNSNITSRKVLMNRHNGARMVTTLLPLQPAGPLGDC